MKPPSLTGLTPAFPFRNFQPRIFSCLSAGSTRAQAVADALSGVTVGLIALPLALALGVASIPAGLATPIPAPALGIFTAIIGGIVVSLLGGSRVQIAGPTAAFVPIVLLVAGQHGFDGLLIATVMAGCILVLLGLCGMGTLIKFIPYPVTSGFTTGIAVALMVGQPDEFLGLDTGAQTPTAFPAKVLWLFSRLSTTNPATLLFAAASAAFIVLWPRWRAHFRADRVPGAIIAMIASAALVAWLGRETTYGVATVDSQFGPGALPHGLPPFVWPDLSFARLRALLGAIESLLSAVVADGLINDRHNANTELVAQGVANIVCPFFCGLPVTGAVARTSAKVKAGGRTPVAGLVHALTLRLIVLLFPRSPNSSRWAPARPSSSS